MGGLGGVDGGWCRDGEGGGGGVKLAAWHSTLAVRGVLSTRADMQVHLSAVLWWWVSSITVRCYLISSLHLRGTARVEAPLLNTPTSSTKYQPSLASLPSPSPSPLPCHLQVVPVFNFRRVDLLMRKWDVRLVRGGGQRALAAVYVDAAAAAA